MNHNLKINILTSVLWGGIAIVLAFIVLNAPWWMGFEASESKEEPVMMADRLFVPLLCDSLEKHAKHAGYEVSGPKWYRKSFRIELIENKAFTQKEFKELSSLAKDYPDWIEQCEPTEQRVLLQTSAQKIDGKYYTMFPLVVLLSFWQ